MQQMRQEQSRRARSSPINNWFSIALACNRFLSAFFHLNFSTFPNPLQHLNVA